MRFPLTTYLFRAHRHEDAEDAVRGPTPEHMRPFASPTPYGFGSNADRPPISVPSMQTGNKLFRRRPGSSSGRLTPLVRF